MEEGITEKKIAEVLRVVGVAPEPIIKSLREKAEKEGENVYRITSTALYTTLLSFMPPSTAAKALRMLLPKTWTSVIAKSVKEARIR